MQGIIDQSRHGQGFIDAGDLGIALLHRHNLFDVFDMLTDGAHLLDQLALLAGQLVRHRDKILR